MQLQDASNNTSCSVDFSKHSELINSFFAILIYSVVLS